MAIDEADGFVQVGLNDVEVGKPLPHPLYDGNRVLLLKRGYVIESIRQCEQLMERGLYRNTRERVIHKQSVVEDVAPVSRESILALDMTKIRIGATLQLESSTTAPRLSVKLIGYLKNVGLIVTPPGSERETIMLKEGQSFIVRFFSGQHAFAFTSVVSRQTSVPFPHIYLSYPREVRGLEIRKNTRIDVDLIAAIEMTDADGVERSGSAKVVNLSVSGGGLRSKVQLGIKDDVIKLKFKVLIHDIQSFLTFDGTICSVSNDPGMPNMPFLYGINFKNPDQEMALALAAFVYQKIHDESK